MKDAGLPNPANHYLPQFDGIRGLAIALVLMVHCYGRGPDLDLATLPSGFLISQVLNFGWVGVELFFVLSGLLVTSILLERKRTGQRLGPFYARRFARILPAYLMVISAVAALSYVRLGPLVDPLSLQARALWGYYALFLNNYFGWIGVDAIQSEKLLSPMWSVATEMQYYLVWPQIVMTFSERQLKFFLPIAIMACVLLRLTAISAGIPAHDVYVASLTHLDGIIAGSFLALWWDQLAGFAKRYGSVGLALSVLVLLAYLSYVSKSSQYLNLKIQLWGYTLVTIVSCFIVMMSVSNPIVENIFKFSPLKILGKYSYFIYLVHLPILLVMDKFFKFNGLFWWLVYYLLVTTGLVIIGAMSWKFFENPIIRWNQRRERCER